MFRHYLLLILRNIRRFRSSFVINLVGLSTGIASALLIYLWVVDELHVDKFHDNEGRLFQVMANHANSDRIETMEATPTPLALALVREVAGIRHTVNLAPASWFPPFTLSHESNSKLKARGQFVDSSYLHVFTLPLLEGNERTALADPHAILISENLATSIFGTATNVTGKTIDWNISQFKGQSTVAGVFQNVPSGSTQQFDFLLTMDAFHGLSGGRDEHWGNHGPSTFLVLEDQANPEVVSERIAGFIKQKLPKSNVTLFLRPYSEGYLYGRYDNGVQAGGRIEYVRLFSLVAAFILVIACINFMNLSTAKATRRIKEVGIKKAIGAGRQSLILQYLAESMFMSTISLIVALILTQLLLPAFSDLTGKSLTLEVTPMLVYSLIAITCVTGFLAGSYPALYLSAFSPAKVLKGKMTTGRGEQWARQGLVIFQFALSVIFIVAVLVVSQQIDFVQTKNIGLDKDHVILFDKEGALAAHQETFLEELRRTPGVANASSVNQNIIGNDSFTVGVSWDGKNPDEVVRFSTMAVDYQMFETLNIELTEGRTFSKDFNDQASIVINEAAVDVMGLKNPVGSKIIFWGNSVEIVGVVKNFHFESFHEKHKPFIFRVRPDESLFMIARLEAGRETEALAGIGKIFNSMNPGFSFDPRFLDQDYQKLYVAEKRVSALSKYFAGLAILISCLGLFGLASFTAERRRKEIGLRKALGSTEAGIVYLLSRDFTRVVLISIAIAIPIAYFLTSSWLDGFAFHVDLQAWYFIAAGLAALGVAWLTVGSQAIRASRVNPTECLNEE